MEDWRHGGFGLYLHWPFCQSKCPYCDFNSHVAGSIDQIRWQNAYLAELDRIALETRGRVLNSVYFGGGTPSLMTDALVGAMLDRIANLWPMANDVEITLEANPGSVDAARFAGYRVAGVNRVSLGMQALNDADLRRLGRMHTTAEAIAALDVAKATFDRVNLDLIYARQDQTLADWESELRRALDLAADHLSLYQLTIEDGTVFAERFAKGMLRGLPDEDLGADFYDLTQDMTRDAGFPAYEVSNHAKIGAESRHNLIYWRGGDYAGVGPGAHGRLTTAGHRQATVAERTPGKWLTLVERGGTAELARETLSGRERGEEYLMMALRLSEGLSLDRLAGMAAGLPNATALRDYLDLGLIKVTDDRLAATEKGRPLLNRVIAGLCA
jgi:oxygen-independent coproporphyrinogen-3 oxidase